MTIARLGIDLDGVCYQFVPKLAQYIHKKTGRPLSELGPAKTWNFFKDQWGYSYQEYSDFVAQGIHDREIFWEGEEFPGCREILDVLSDDFEIVIVTARFFNNVPHELSEAATLHWLESHSIPYNELIISNDKTNLNLDLLLDDAPHNIENALLHGEGAVIFDQDWNIDIDGDRVHGWHDFAHYVRDRFNT